MMEWEFSCKCPSHSVLQHVERHRPQTLHLSTRWWYAGRYEVKDVRYLSSSCFSLQPVPKDDVVCVSKEAVQDKNAVKLKLKASSSCVSFRKKTNTFCPFMYLHMCWCEIIINLCGRTERRKEGVFGLTFFRGNNNTAERAERTRQAPHEPKREGK